MLDLNSLLIFVKVADTKSFSEAARHLKMPVSTVSRRVAEIEDQLSVRLLDRSTRGLRLTSIGDEVFSQARHGIDLRETIDNTQWEDQITWRFTHDDGRKKAITFRPAIAMNDFAGLSTLLLNGGCIGSIPPIVHPELLDSGSLVEVLPHWHFRLFSFSVVYPMDRPLSRAARLFKDFSTRAVPALFPYLPS